MASGGTPSTNRVFLFRLQTLIIDGGTLVLRKLFDQRLPNVTLKIFLTNEKAPINYLRGQKILTRTQYDLLYPKGGQLPNSSNFDITLIICLLSNLKSLGINHKYKWNATPQPADTSVEADLCRLKGFRNEVAHISSTCGIQPGLFQTKWTEIEQVLLRLNSAVPNPDPTLKQTIDSYKNEALDPMAEKRIQKEIDKWQKFERGLETEMILIKRDVKEVNQSVDRVSVGVKQVQKDVITVSEEVQKIDKNVKKVSEEVKEVGKDVEKVNEEVKGVGKDVIQVSEEVKDVRKDVKQVSEGVKEVGKDVKQVKEEVKEVGKDVIQVSEEVKEVRKDAIQVSKEVKEVRKDVIQVSEEVKEVGKDVIQVSEEVKEVGKDVIQVSEEAKEVGKEVKQVKEDVKEVGKDVIQVSEEVKEVKKDVIQVSEEVKEVGKDVIQVSEEAKEVGKEVIQVSENLQKVDKNVKKVSEEVKEVGKDVKQVSEEVKEVEKDVIQLNEEVKEVAKDASKVSECITEVSEIRKDVKELKQHVEVLTQGLSKSETDTKEDEPPSAKVETPVLGEDEAYLKMKTKLQDDLIEFYRQKHATIILSPLIDEKCTPLLAFHVMPNIQIIKVKRAPGGGKEERTLVTPFRNVFYKGNNVLREIYLTADAGLGKTAFCKRLALTWCQAKKHIDENEYFLEEEKEALAGFDFMFLLMLRDSSGECDIDDMILSQLVPELSNTYTSNDLEKLMSKASCLVILDGLDEWTHPSTSCKRRHGQIPHRKARKWTIMTTTRPWKLSLSGLSSSQIDQRLEITGLGPESANKLKRSVIAHLYGEEDENEIEQYMKDFNRAVQVKHISDFETVPLLLMYLLFLWHDNLELGESLCELYSNIIQLLLSRTVQILEDKDLPPMSENTQDCIPKYISENELCGQFYKILTDLGHLAFHTLFKETRENTIVFASSIAKQYLNEQNLKFCLKTGMITESKSQVKLVKQKSKVSFAHKTVQEYFAALYIRSTPDQTSVPETVLSKCTCVKDILEMSKFLIFLSGFNVNVSSSISSELMKIINEDEITREYRSSLGESEPLKQFQDMCVSCCKELPHETEVSFCLQDVFIDESCQQEQYRENLKQLTSRNKQNIRSLYIDIDRDSDTPAPYSSAQEVIEYFALSDLENIEKIHYEGEYNDRDILPLLKRSVQSLSLSCSGSSWSDLLYEKVTSLQNLEAIHIGLFKMSHEQLTLLYDYISHRHCMREIDLSYLECSDHGEDSCTGYSLELSKHSQLRKIILCDIPVSELNINMSSLEECELQWLSNPDLVLSFINCVPADSKVHTFECSDLKSSAAIKTMLQTLPLLVHVKSVWLFDINLGNINLCSSEMVNLEYVVLLMVTMPASLLRAIVTVLQQLTQTVTVDIKYCNITPESEFVTVKEEIKQSSQFRVRVDGEDRWRGKTLEFETIKDGD